MKEIQDEIRRTLLAYVNQGKLHEQVFLSLSADINQVVETEFGDKIEKLKEMIKNWEATMGEQDNSFYSLGLRRAIDVITDNDVLNQLPILEKEDTPDE
jgi:hypothetical protein